MKYQKNRNLFRLAGLICLLVCLAVVSCTAVADGDEDASLEDLNVQQSAATDFMRYSAIEWGYGWNVEGKHNGSFIQTTCGNSGYQTAIQIVGSNEIHNLSSGFVYGKVYTYEDRIQFRITASFTDNGRAVAITYELHNLTENPLPLNLVLPETL